MRPAPRLLRGVALWTLASVAVAFYRPALPVWIALGGALGLAAAWDALRARREPDPAVSRRIASSLALGTWCPVELAVEGRGERRLRLEVQDHPPADFQVAGLPARALVGPGQGVRVGYRVRPRERGDARFGPADLLIRSPWGLFEVRRRVGPETPVRVYPDFRAVAGYALLAAEERTSQLGIRKRRRRGAGMEFHQLRPYREGDATRHIDWKASSKHRELISREYQEERDQQVVFLLDCGRKMRARDDELAHFDFALNALLLLSHVALRQGDAVGLLTFSGEQRWLAPRKGAGSLRRIVEAVYDLSTSAAPSDYLVAARTALHSVAKRSLVVWITNLRDEDTGELLLAAGLLRRRHLVLVASLRERVLRTLLEPEVRSFPEALRVAATHGYLASRAEAHARARREGLLVLDVEPAELPVSLTNAYLDLKARGML